jgi:type II secretory ATPase GspE/PulE/Tfp pilus assembly ATPase PilB-like protein
MDASKAKDVGELLVGQGKLTVQQLEVARRRQERLHVSLHRAIVDLNYASEEATYRALAEIKHLDFVDVTRATLEKSVLDLVPVKIVFHYQLIPLFLEHDLLTVAFGEPPQPLEQGNLRLQLGKRLKVVLTTPSSLHATIKKQFGLGAATVQKLRQDRGKDDASGEIVFDVKAADEGAAADPTIIDFVDQLLMEALRLQATDLHIEPYFSSVRLRYRIDGIMQTVPTPEGLRQLYGSIVSRLKIMASLNIAEKRLPHDGHIAMKTGGEEYDLRVSIIPTKHGEAVCLRILGRQNLFLDVNQLGMDPAQEALFKQMIQLPQGLILLTGPTGSGKTTTLYAALAQANDDRRKIITIEDPVEYQLQGATQIQVRDDIGLTFASSIRSILRHDPDVILVGEIRDAETAEIAIRAAQTGHLVFSTLHTNDSISAVTRLLEIKIDPFLIGSSLVCSIAQRLSRRICRHCITEDTAIPDEVRKEMAQALNIAPGEARAFIGKGCVECNDRGYRGRVALYEFFVVNNEIADAIDPGVKAGTLRDLAAKHGWRSLREQAWPKVQNGTISIEEQQRLTYRINFDPALPPQP